MAGLTDRGALEVKEGLTAITLVCSSTRGDTRPAPGAEEIAGHQT